MLFTRISFLLFLISILFLLSNSAYSQKPKADLIIVDAKVITMDKKRPKAQAIAIKDNKIIAVEKRFGRIEKYRGRRTKQINARGRVIIPGFNDSHTHFMGIGNLFSSIDLKNVRRPQEIADRIAFYVRYLPKGRWVLGGGWNNETWDSNKLPTKELIDSISPNNPVFIYNKDATMALANSVALKMARIDRKKGDIEGGKIVKDSSGEPTGILKGQAMLFVKNIAPISNTKLELEIAETASNYAASLGVTSVQDVHSDYISEVLQKLQTQGKLKTRVYDCTPLYDWKKLADKGIKRATGDAFVRTGCLKGFTNGYPEEEPQLYEYALNADKSDLQVMIHAIGSVSNASILKTYEQIFAKNGIKDRRFRIEHAHGFAKDDLSRFVKSNIIASMQPHLFGGRDPFNEMIKKKATIAFGSDASITDFDPILGIHDAVNSSYSLNGRNQSTKVKEAIYLYTMGSAYAEFQENIKGSITVGKLADIVILATDIFKVSPEKIKDVEVDITIVDGKVVYNKRATTPLPNPNVRALP